MIMAAGVQELTGGNLHIPLIYLSGGCSVIEGGCGTDEHMNRAITALIVEFIHVHDGCWT